MGHSTRKNGSTYSLKYSHHQEESHLRNPIFPYLWDGSRVYVELKVWILGIVSYDLSTNEEAQVTSLELVEELQNAAYLQNIAYQQSVTRYHDKCVKKKDTTKVSLVLHIGRKDNKMGKLSHYKKGGSFLVD